MKRHFILLTTILSFFVTSVNAAMQDFCLPDFYAGADLQLRDLRFQPNYGGNIYKSRDYPQANFYFGLMGNEYIGIEAGYEASRGRTHTVLLPKKSIAFGAAGPEDDIILKTVARFRAFHSSIVGFLPICDSKKFKFLASVGFANVQVKLQENATQVANIPVSTTPGLFFQSKIVLRLMTGLQYMCTDYFGLRTSVTWENTAQLSNIEMFRTKNQVDLRAKARNSFAYGLGIFIKF